MTEKELKRKEKNLKHDEKIVHKRAKKAAKREAKKNRPNNKRPIRHPIKTFKGTMNDYQRQARDNYYHNVKPSYEQDSEFDAIHTVHSSINHSSNKETWICAVILIIVFIFIICDWFL